MLAGMSNILDTFGNYACPKESQLLNSFAPFKQLLKEEITPSPLTVSSSSASRELAWEPDGGCFRSLNGVWAGTKPLTVGRCYVVADHSIISLHLHKSCVCV